MKIACALLLAGCTSVAPQTPQWTPLFDGESLAGWAETNFGAQGEVHVESGELIFEIGEPLPGVTWTGECPSLDYEVELDVTRLLGTDFFCGLTFPVGDSHCSLILGGWGGSLIGLSNVDGKDASENETRRYMGFEQDQSYHIRLRVSAERIEAWVDGQQIVSQPSAGHTFSIRPEVELSRPFGIASYLTATAVRNVEMRRLDE